MSPIPGCPPRRPACAVPINLGAGAAGNRYDEGGHEQITGQDGMPFPSPAADPDPDPLPQSPPARVPGSGSASLERW